MGLLMDRQVSLLLSCFVGAGEDEGEEQVGAPSLGRHKGECDESGRENQGGRWLKVLPGSWFLLAADRLTVILFIFVDPAGYELACYSLSPLCVHWTAMDVLCFAYAPKIQHTLVCVICY